MAKRSVAHLPTDFGKAAKATWGELDARFTPMFDEAARIGADAVQEFLRVNGKKLKIKLDAAGSAILPPGVQNSGISSYLCVRGNVAQVSNNLIHWLNEIPINHKYRTLSRRAIHLSFEGYDGRNILLNDIAYTAALGYLVKEGNLTELAVEHNEGGK